jgi:hypothetical protein
VKRLPLLGLTTLALGIIALAAETIRFEPALNTITKYRNTTQTTAEILSSSVVTSDGLPVPKPFENILESLKTSLNTNQILETTEKVVAVLSDGTRQLETKVLSNNAQPPQIGYEILSSMTPEGLFNVSSFKFDAATLAQLGFSVLDDSFTNSMRDIHIQAQPRIYGKSLEVGQSLKFSSNASDSISGIYKSIPEVKIQTEGLQNTLEYTYQGRNSSNDYTFKTLGNTTAGKLLVDFGVFTLEQTSSEMRSEGEAMFFADGRAKTNRQTTDQTLTQIQKLKSGEQTITISVSIRSKTISNTEILP